MPSMNDVREHLTEEEVKAIKEELYNRVLLDNRQELCRKIIPDRHYALLRQRKIFDKSTEEIIEAGKTSERRASRFIDELERIGGVIAYPTFIESIDKTQIHLKERLNKCYENLQENIPIEILCRHTNILQVTGNPPAEMTHQNNLKLNIEDEVRPEVDMASLRETMDSYNQDLKAGDPLEDEEEENDLVEDEIEEMYVHEANRNQNQF